MQILGIQLDGAFCKAALLQKERSAVKLCAVESAPIAQMDNVKQLYTNSFKGRVVSGLSSGALMIRSSELEVPSCRYLDAALALQLEGSPHLQSDHIFSVAHPIPKEGKKVLAYFCSGAKEDLRSHLDALSRLEAIPSSVSSNSLALVHYIRWKEASLQDAFLIDLGYSDWSCVWMEGRELKKSHCIPGGVQKLLSALWEDRKKILLPQELESAAKQVDLLQLKSNLNPHLSEAVESLRGELSRIICSFSRFCDRMPIFFTGSTDALGHLVEYLLEDLEGKVLLSLHRGGGAHDKFAVPIGLALEQTENPLQLLQGEFFPEKNWRSAGLYALILLGCCLVGSGLILGGGRIWTQGKLEKVCADWKEAMEPWGVSPLASSGIEGMERGIHLWKEKMSSFRREYPYILQAPRVSEVLSWIWSHPLLKLFQQEGDVASIKDFHYHLVSYPTVESSREPYQVKVEMEIELKNPLHARQFHEALLAEEEMIDSAHELDWEAQGDDYRISFILKNHQAPYVP